MTDLHPKNAVDASGAEVVEVYWRPGCPFCLALMGSLRRSGLPLQEINIWEDPAAAARVRSVAGGNETVPTVFVGDQAMVNPTVRQVLTAAGGGGQRVPRWWDRFIGH